MSRAKVRTRLPLEEFKRAQIRGNLLTEVKSVFTLRLLRRGGEFMLMVFSRPGRQRALSLRYFPGGKVWNSPTL
jgi:hypothetical protein